MKIEFNYKNPYLYLLSLFGIILILSGSNIINSNFALYYSIIGIGICFIAWVIDLDYDYQIEQIKNGTHPFYFDESCIIEIRGKKNQLRIILLFILAFILLLAFIMTIVL